MRGFRVSGWGVYQFGGNLDSCICWSFVGGAFFLFLTCNYWVFFIGWL